MISDLLLDKAPRAAHAPATLHIRGRHVIATLRGVDAAVLNDEEDLRCALTQALCAAGATVLSMHAERFPVQGVTLIAMLAESHASVHTWPEAGVAEVDIYTCGPTADPMVALEHLKQAVGCTRSEHLLLVRDVHV
ncbi:adenosylmethionine decarboxylase [Nonomuraea sp. NPDC003754]